MKIIFEDIEEKIFESKEGRIYEFCQECKLIQKIVSILNKMINRTKTKKIIAAFLAVLVLLWPNSYTIAIAQTAPTAPSAPSAPTAPTAPDVPDTIDPTAPSAPTAPDAPDAPGDPSTWDEVEERDEEYRDYRDQDDEEKSDEKSSEEENDTQEAAQVALVPIEENETGGQDDGGNVGDTTIDTGDANIEGAIVTEANTNILASEEDMVDGIGIVNAGNGTESENTGLVVIDDTNDTLQTNTAVVTNNMGLGAVTGDNESSKNVGNTTINTGDANTTGTIVNAVNTNIDGILVSEFNIVDDHMGDYILDFNSGCVAGCGGGSTTVKNTGNGSDSLNTGEVDITNTDNTFQTNDATLVNDMVLYSNTGDNEADKNTSGDSEINTGDANVNANILNYANNNLAGDVIYAVVNIFGDLIGDIILSEEKLQALAISVLVENSDNGSGSVNSGEVMEKNTDNITQFNTVDIDNNLIIDANTGDNETSDNTGGKNSITTGDVDVLAQIVNVANMNLVGGNWWLVIVNDAGNWIGKIIGFDGVSMAASDGIDLGVGSDGQINVTNSGNGSGSENTGSLSQENTNNITQVNNAKIVNNVDLSANTGGNSASKNTNGNSTITTGDANVVANIVNFVNNNIVGTGRLFVTMVNVFGSWFGDFVGPGYEKETKSETGVGGTAAAATNINTNSGSSGGSSGSIESSGQTASSETSAEILIASSQTEGRGVLGLFINNNDSSGGSGSDDSSDSQMTAGTNDEEVMGDKTVNVNLAWLVFAIPLAGILLIAKKRFMLLNLLPGKNLGNV